MLPLKYLSVGKLGCESSKQKSIVMNRTRDLAVYQSNNMASYLCIYAFINVLINQCIIASMHQWINLRVYNISLYQSMIASCLQELMHKFASMCQCIYMLVQPIYQRNNASTYQYINVSMHQYVYACIRSSYSNAMHSINLAHIKVSLHQCVSVFIC